MQSENLAAAKERLAQALRDTKTASTEVIAELGRTASERSKEATEKAQQKIGALKEKTQEMEDWLRAGAQEAVEKADDFARKNPWKVAGIAVAAGAAIGSALTAVGLGKKKD